jgi:outer membrane protein assembly factor BamB
MPQCSYAARRLLCARPGLVFALDPADGSTLWRHPVAETVRDEPPVVSGGLVQPEVGLLGPLEALDPATGKPAWQEDMPAYDGLRTVGDMLLLTRADGMVTGVDSATGRTKWAHRVPGQAVPYFTSFAGERRPAAYAASPSADGQHTRVTAVDPASGDVRWDAELAGELKPVGAAADGSVFLVVEGAAYGDVSTVVRYTPATGATRRVTLPIPVEAAQAGVHGDTLYLMGAGGSLVAVDMAAGKQAWRLETGVSRGSSPVSDGRHVYVTAPLSALVAIAAYAFRAAETLRSRFFGAYTPLRACARRVSSASSTSSSMERFGMSMRMRSPSSTRAMVPPAAASGEAWPMDRPEVPPENRPSVTRAQAFPRPRPLRYEVG